MSEQRILLPVCSQDCPDARGMLASVGDGRTPLNHFFLDASYANMPSKIRPERWRVLASADGDRPAAADRAGEQARVWHPRRAG